MFALTTYGGDEYCGHVIYSSLTEMQWDTSGKSYKVIFIAGNEDFRQGDISFTKACEEAKKKGVIVNTIYCGDKLQGIHEHWNMGGECGNGSYTNINQDAKEIDIPTPFDSTIYALNSKLNQTYIGYGAMGYDNYARQAEVDQSNYSFSKSALIKRSKVKANSKVYNNASWDLVDANDNDSTIVKKINLNTLPDSLKNKSRDELQKIVADKKLERSSVQKQIEIYNEKRDAYLEDERKRNANRPKDQTLETEIEKILREQVKRFGMEIK